MIGLFHALPMLRIGFVFAREGVLSLIDPTPLPWPARVVIRVGRLFERRNGAAGGVRLAAALTRLGPTYVKLGQFMATRPDVVGVQMARDLEALQDRMPPFPQAEAEAVVAHALERRLSDAYRAFGPAVAAASIAQVHRADKQTCDGAKGLTETSGDGERRKGRDRGEARLLSSHGGGCATPCASDHPRRADGRSDSPLLCPRASQSRWDCL